MNRSDELTVVRRVYVTALLLSVVHYIDAGLAVLVMAVRIVTTGGALSRPQTTTGRSPVGSASH